MSDDNTSFDKDPNRKPKKKSGSGHSDLKAQPSSRKGSKDYQVHFEPKSGERSSKEQLSANKNNLPYEGHRDNNGRNNRQEKPKSHRNPRKESRDQTPGTLRRKYPRVPKKFILELYQKTTISRDIEHLLSISNQLFVREKQNPANEESFDLDPNDGLLANPPKPSYSSSATTSHTNSTATSITTTGTTQPAANTANTNTATSSTVPASSGSTSNNATGSTTPSKKPMEMFDFAQTKVDPIQAMREKMKGKPAAKPAEDIKKPEDNGFKRSNLPSAKEEVKAPEPEKPKVEEKAPAKEQQDDGERYSDVDAEFERKVQNNEIVEPQENDLEDDFLDDRSKENFARLDDRSRPEWEGVDSNQVFHQAQREEFQSGLPQDKRTIFGDRYIESRGETDSQRSKTDRSDGSRHIARDSGDFSKVSFENDRANISDEFNMQQGEYYGASAGMRANPQQQYAGMGYNPSEYRGHQQQMQPQPQYGNKGYMGAQQGVTKQGSQTNIQQSQSPVPKSTSAGTPPDFIFKYFSPDYDAKVWSYVDLEQKTQGPYSGRTMDEWYSKGYLPLELHVTIGKSNGYRTLKELAEVIINHTTQAQTQAQQPQAQVQAQPQVQTAQSRAPQQYQQQTQQNYGQQYQQYQQYQQQQQHQQQQQYQQHPQHSQYTQQQYYQQQQQPQPQYQSQSGAYGGQGGQGGQGQGAQSYLATKNKSYGQNEEAYYGQQSPSVQQKQYMSYGGKTVQEINPQEYYGNYGGGTPTTTSSYYSGSGQEGQQNVNPNYGFKASPTTSLNSSGYYQEQGQGQGGAYRTPTNQIGYNQPQPQKQQQQQYNKASYQQGSMQNYSGVSQMPASTGYGQSMSPGFSGQGNVREYGNSGSGSGSYGGQGGSGNAMYMMQQQHQQQQMGNKGQMQNQGYPVEMSAHLKNMLGMMRPPSQQGDHPDLQ